MATDGNVEVPAVTGMRLDLGSEALQSEGLCVLVVQGSGDERRVIITEQSPKAGTAVTAGSTVRVVIDTPMDIQSTMEPIAERNHELGCDNEAVGVTTP